MTDDALAERLRALQPDLPIVVLSAYAGSAKFAAIHALRDPLQVISKPADLQALARELRWITIHSSRSQDP